MLPLEDARLTTLAFFFFEVHSRHVFRVSTGHRLTFLTLLLRGFDGENREGLNSKRLSTSAVDQSK